MSFQAPGMWDQETDLAYRRELWAAVLQHVESA